MGTRLSTIQRFKRYTCGISMAYLPAMSFAQGLPTLENPSRGTGGGIMETLRNYGYDIVLWWRYWSWPACLLVCVITPTEPTRKSIPARKPGASLG